MNKQIVADTFKQIATDILSGNYGKRVRIGLTAIASEHGQHLWEEVIRLADTNAYELVIIGNEFEGFESYPAETLEDAHKIMVDLLDEKKIDGCVSLHFDFPIGTSTVGQVTTPVRGKNMFLANTTGTAAINRVEAMIQNAISGIVTAKANGINNPTVGILNVEGARQVDKALHQLKENGYDINFAVSGRADGGSVMRGNDLLNGVPDVMVTDPLTGNLLIKMFSSFTSGGSYETTGAGYGPGIPVDPNGYSRLVNIISRASGAPQILNALRFCANSAKNNIFDVNETERHNACKAGLDEIINALTVKKSSEKKADFKMPAKEIVGAAIAGIDILEIEDYCQKLWENGIYAESGMGCTGPVILVTEANLAKAKQILGI